MRLHPEKKLNGKQNTTIGTYVLPHSFTTSYAYAVATDNNIARIWNHTVSQYKLNLYNSYTDTAATTHYAFIICIGY